MSRSKISIALSLLLLGGLLTSCGASAEEAALKANCERIFANLKAIQNAPEVFENSEYADSDSVALLLGQGTRKEVEKKILAQFPYLDEIIVGRAKDKQQVDLYYYSGLIYLIKEALTGTDIEFPFSTSEMKAIASTPDSYDDEVVPVADKIFGDYMELKNHQGCAIVDQEKENSSSDNNTSVAFSRASDAYLDFASFLQGVRDCDVSGWYEGNKCEKVDFVSGPDNYTPSNELSPEEKEILAERQKNSQNGSQGSSGTSGYSSAKPGQLCDSVGEVVSTSDYGNLTCKIVIIRRLQAQMWMRS